MTTGAPLNDSATFLYARNCSSSSGIVVRPTTRNSVRMSPTPSAPLRAANSASSGKSTFARSTSLWPSSVIDSALRSSSSSSASCASRCERSLKWRISSAVGFTEIVPARAVEDRHLAGVQAARGIAQPDDGGDAERARENRDVRHARAGVGRDRGDRLAVELHREARRQVVRDEDRVRALRHIDRIVIGKPEQEREHADLHVGEIADALAHHRRGVAREVVPQIEHRDLERRLRREILPDQSIDAADHVGVLEDQHLRLEDPRLLLARVVRGAAAHVLQSLARARERRAEALDLGRNLLIGHDPLRHLRDFPVEHVHRPDDDAR